MTTVCLFYLTAFFSLVVYETPGGRLTWPEKVVKIVFLVGGLSALQIQKPWGQTAAEGSLEL